MDGSSTSNLLESYREICSRMGDFVDDDETAPEGGLKFLSRLGKGSWGMPGSVFSNHELNLEAVDAIGFDYDYTLVSYNNALQGMIYEKALKRLVDDFSYPLQLRKKLSGTYDPDFAIRGLTFDASKGLLVKLTSSFEVAPDHCFRGRERLSRDEAIHLYGHGSRHVSKSYMSQYMRGMYDLFSIAEATLLADVTQELRDSRIKFSNAAVSEDVRAAIQTVHASGDMHREVQADVEKYIHPSPEMQKMLRNFQDNGKILFLLSNSGFTFIDHGMRFIAGDKWTEMFDVTMTSAQKPSFYSGSAPFRAILSNNRESFRRVHALRRGCAYSRGNLRDLVRMLGLTQKRALYFGDHLYADLVEPTKKLGWYTGAIIRELENEVAQQRQPEFRKLHWRVELIEEIMRSVQEGSDEEAQNKSVLDDLLAERAELLLDMHSMYNKNFGSIFTAGTRKSLFAGSVERYADIYASRLENFLAYSPSHRFIPSARQSFPHEPPHDHSLVRKLLTNPHHLP